jgi:hypothetical protein
VHEFVVEQRKFLRMALEDLLHGLTTTAWAQFQWENPSPEDLAALSKAVGPKSFLAFAKKVTESGKTTVDAALRPLRRVLTVHHAYSVLHAATRLVSRAWLSLRGAVAAHCSTSQFLPPSVFAALLPPSRRICYSIWQC